MIAKLALGVAAPLLETILYNRTRLLDSPEILDNVKRNAAATTQILGVVQEIETEFFGDKKRAYAVSESEETDAPAQAPALSLESEMPPEDLSLEGLPLDPQEREAVLSSRINKMTMREKIKLALIGTREARSILIRDTNREVLRSVLGSPKLTVGEIESFAAMRSVSEEVLRQIGNSKGWMKSHAVVQNLVKNPKTPPLISQRVMFRLNSRDLMLLSRDRSIAEAVRRNAERLLSQRNKSKSEQ